MSSMDNLLQQLEKRSAERVCFQGPSDITQPQGDDQLCKHPVVVNLLHNYGSNQLLKTSESVGNVNSCEFLINEKAQTLNFVKEDVDVNRIIANGSVDVTTMQSVDIPSVKKNRQHDNQSKSGTRPAKLEKQHSVDFENFSASELPDCFPASSASDSIPSGQQIDTLPMLDSVLTGQQTNTLSTSGSIISVQQIDTLPTLDSVLSGQQTNALSASGSILSGQQIDTLPTLDSILSGQQTNTLSTSGSIISGQQIDTLPTLDSVLSGQQTNALSASDSILSGQKTDTAVVEQNLLSNFGNGNFVSNEPEGELPSQPIESEVGNLESTSPDINNHSSAVAGSSKLQFSDPEIAGWKLDRRESGQLFWRRDSSTLNGIDPSSRVKFRYDVEVREFESRGSETEDLLEEDEEDDEDSVNWDSEKEMLIKTCEDSCSSATVEHPSSMPSSIVYFFATFAIVVSLLYGWFTYLFFNEQTHIN